MCNDCNLLSVKGIVNRGKELPPVVSETARFISSLKSYITIEKGAWKVDKKFELSLKFRTLNKDGLLFFMGQDQTSGTIPNPDYFKLYMRNGEV